MPPAPRARKLQLGSRALGRLEEALEEDPTPEFALKVAKLTGVLDGSPPAVGPTDPGDVWDERIRSDIRKFIDEPQPNHVDGSRVVTPVVRACVSERIANGIYPADPSAEEAEFLARWDQTLRPHPSSDAFLKIEPTNTCCSS